MKNWISVISLIAVSVLYFNCTNTVLEDLENNPTPPDVAKYNPHVKAVIDAHCINCHGDTNPSAGIVLSNYNDTRFQTETGNLLNSVNNDANPMPPSGLLPQWERDLFQQWVDDGYQEN